MSRASISGIAVMRTLAALERVGEAVYLAARDRPPSAVLHEIDTTAAQLAWSSCRTPRRARAL